VVGHPCPQGRGVVRKSPWPQERHTMERDRSDPGVARAAKRVGVVAALYEGTKHSTASAAIRAGVPLDVVQKSLGHTDPRTTLGYAKRAAVPTLADATAPLRRMDSEDQVPGTAKENGGADGTRTRSVAL
jgi:integrase